MSSALLNGARRALAQRARTASARSFNTSAPKRGGGGGDEPAYIHAEKMYDIGATKGRTVVFGTACAAVVLIGGYIPIYACQFQQRKAAG